LDAYLAATYHERGIRRLATGNAADFALFKVFILPRGKGLDDFPVKLDPERAF
jgi:hypothetical protein